MTEKRISVLFVCLGNICRSAMAEGMLRARATNEGLASALDIDSAGTGSWHVGNPPDRRAQKAALSRGIDISGQQARQINVRDFECFDYILAMDEQNQRDVTRMAGSTFKGNLQLFMDFAPDMKSVDVPDPYYGGEDGFAQVLEMLDAGCAGFINHIRRIKRL